MESFIIAFMHRVLSGLQSSFGYSKNEYGLLAMMAVLMLYPWATEAPPWLFITFYMVNIAIGYMKTASFIDDWKFLGKFKDIHLWEGLLTGGFFVYMVLAGYNILMMCCSVYPALILHKGFINLGSKLSFFAEATDDATGKTYSIPLLGIKIPRLGTKFRLIVAGLSLIAALVIWLAKWDLPIASAFS